jgi:parvulin-like peptidyl-prolyl isomerase
LRIITRSKGLILLISLMIILSVTACTAQSDVVAIVNGEKIKAAALEDKLVKYIKAVEAQGYVFEGEEGEEQKGFFKEQLLDEMIELLLIEQAARGKGIKINQEDVDEELNNLKISMGEEQFDKLLEESFFSKEDLDEIAKQQLIIRELFESVTKDITVEESQVKEFFNENKDYIVMMKVAHILVAAREGDATEEEAAAAEQIAKDLIKRLDDGEDFADLAKKYSDDPGSAQLGGELDYFFTKYDQNFVPEFVQGSYELDVGEYSSEPVKSMHGFHIIKALDKIESFDKFKDELEMRVLEQEKGIVFEEYFQKLRDKAKIKNNL